MNLEVDEPHEDGITIQFCYERRGWVFGVCLG